MPSCPCDVPQEKYDEAMPLLERALAIRTKTLGESHEHTVDTRSWLGYVRHKHQVRGLHAGVRLQRESTGPVVDPLVLGIGLAPNSI